MKKITSEMNCFDCNIQCEMSNPLGYCFREKEYDEEAVKRIEKVDPAEIITTTDIRPWVGVNRPGITVHPIAIISAARDLVDAVERYVEPKPGQEFVHRSEILLKKNALKKLL